MTAAAIAEAVAGSLDAATRNDHPFRHWLLEHVLPASTCAATLALPFPPPAIDDTRGKRETHNASRVFFSADACARFGVCATVAEAFRTPRLVAAFEARCGRSLRGSFLRIEHCLDTDGFWLEPHTDIGAKLFTMLIYLSEGPDAAGWGTDIYDRACSPCDRAPAAFNSGLLFIPAHDTWHGFAKRPIAGIRRSLIVNYVKDEWRARHELAFPDTPIG